MSNNLGLPQMTANTADKDDFLNDIFALLDASITSSIAIDASANAVASAAQVQNYLKIIATNVPAAGTSITLPAVAKMFILGNDKASLGPVTYAVGSSGITVAVGARCIVHLDGTANGIEVVSVASSAKLANLSDVDLATAPTDGQALIWSAAESKFKPGTVATSSGGTSSGSTSSGTSGGSITATKLRISCPPGSGYYAYSFAEVGLLDSNGNAIAIPANSTFNASTVDGSNAAANAFDGNAATYWASVPSNNNGVCNTLEWLEVVFGSPVAGLAGIAITSRNDANSAKQVPTLFAITAGTASSAEIGFMASGNTYGASEQRTYIFPIG